jgi:hypothetical protein
MFGRLAHVPCPIEDHCADGGGRGGDPNGRGGCGVFAGAGGYRCDRPSGQAALDEAEPGAGFHGFLVLLACRVEGAVDDGEEPFAFVGVWFFLRDVARFGDRFELPAEPVELLTHSVPPPGRGIYQAW